MIRDDEFYNLQEYVRKLALRLKELEEAMEQLQDKARRERGDD